MYSQCPRFAGKPTAADPQLFRLVEQALPADKLHLGIYTLVGNAPLYEGRGDLANGMYPGLKQDDTVRLYGMSFAHEAMVMQHYNDPSVDTNGFDRKIPWIGLTAITNIVEKPTLPTKEALRRSATNPNPTSADEVLSVGKATEEILVPAILTVCTSLSQNPLTK